MGRWSVWTLGFIAWCGFMYISFSIFMVSLKDHWDTSLPVDLFDIFTVTTQLKDGNAIRGSYGYPFLLSSFPTMLVDDTNNSTLYEWDGKNYTKNNTLIKAGTGGCWGDINNDGFDELISHDSLYMNRGGTLILKPNFTLPPTRSCVIVDITNDGLADIFHIDTSNKLSFFKHIGRGVFQDFTQQTLLPKFAKSVVGITTQSINFITQNGMLESRRKKFPFGPRENLTNEHNGDPIAKSILYDMNSDGHFDVVYISAYSSPIIASPSTKSFSVVDSETNFEDDRIVDLTIADFNNDMLPDIAIITQIYSSPNISCTLYLNNGKGGWAKKGGTVAAKSGHVSVASIDFDSDGWVDLTIFNGLVYQFRNNLGDLGLKNNWIKIEIATTPPHTLVGVIVGVVANGVEQQQLIDGSHNSIRRLHFGVGNATLVSQIFVRWKGARRQIFQGYLPNQLVTILSPSHLRSMEHYPIFDKLHATGGPKMQCEPGYRRLKPSFLILGVWKAGTSSLARTLETHPQMHMTDSKELYYFSKHIDILPLEWYWSLFPCNNNASHISFEATAAYFYSPSAPALVKQHLPNAKFIVLVREPVERLYSHYEMSERSMNNFTAWAQESVMLLESCLVNFNKCMANSMECIANTSSACATKATSCFSCTTTVMTGAGFYYFEAMNWFKLFPREQFKFIDYADFVANYSTVLVDIEKYLGVDIIQIPPIAKNISPKRTPMSNETRLLLKEFYKPYTKLFNDLMKVDYGWNN